MWMHVITVNWMAWFFCWMLWSCSPSVYINFGPAANFLSSFLTQVYALRVKSVNFWSSLQLLLRFYQTEFYFLLFSFSHISQKSAGTQISFLFSSRKCTPRANRRSIATTITSILSDVILHSFTFLFSHFSEQVSYFRCFWRKKDWLGILHTISTHNPFFTLNYTYWHISFKVFEQLLQQPELGLKRYIRGFRVGKWPQIVSNKPQVCGLFFQSNRIMYSCQHESAMFATYKKWSWVVVWPLCLGWSVFRLQESQRHWSRWTGAANGSFSLKLTAGPSRLRRSQWRAGSRHFFFFPSTILLLPTALLQICASMVCPAFAYTFFFATTSSNSIEPWLSYNSLCLHGMPCVRAQILFPI